jgi:DNA-binding response OmpR family regulator
MVTAIGEIQDKISSLRHGVDDYIVKPYNPGEVVVRSCSAKKNEYIEYKI